MIVCNKTSTFDRESRSALFVNLVDYVMFLSQLDAKLISLQAWSEIHRVSIATTTSSLVFYFALIANKSYKAAFFGPDLL